MNGADALIHFAALAQPWHASQAATHNINVSLSYNALCAAVEAGVKRVVMASRCVILTAHSFLEIINE